MSKYTAGPFSFKGPTINLQTGKPDIISILAPVKENGWSTILAEITVRNTTEEEALANAALFVAAPELLDALKEMTNEFDGNYKGANDPEGTTEMVRHSLLRQARKAIKKAEGK